MPFFAELGAGSRDERKRAYADPAFRDAFRAVTDERPGYWKRATFTYVPGQENLLDRSVADVARERQSDPVDLVLDLSLEHDLRVRVSFALMNDDEEEVAELLHDPGTVVALSDAGAHMSQLCDACFTTHLLGHWVREKEELTLEQAVRMLTSRPAEVVGIRDRGRLAEGWPADLVVFDPDTVGPSSLRRVHDLPAGGDRLIAEAHGIEAVVVNGELLRRHGAQVLDAADALPGHVLRHGAASPA
jgi:N-acyl-D-aspartate/D-glutamate deacylase